MSGGRVVESSCQVRTSNRVHTLPPERCDKEHQLPQTVAVPCFDFALNCFEIHNLKVLKNRSFAIIHILHEQLFNRLRPQIREVKWAIPRAG